MVTFFGKTKKVTRPLADGSFGLPLVLTRHSNNNESHRGTLPVGATKVATATTQPSRRCRRSCEFAVAARAAPTVGYETGRSPCRSDASRDRANAPTTNFAYARWFRLRTSEDQMLPSASGRVTFFVQSNKESNQRKCFFLFSNQEPLSFGACAGMRHTGHPWPGWRTARVLRAALRVSICLWRVRGGGGGEEPQQQRHAEGGWGENWPAMRPPAAI